MSTTRTMRVNKWGNSLGIRLPSDFADYIQLKEKSLVAVTVEGETLIISKIEEETPMKTLKELFDMYPADYIEEEEIDWGYPIGGEVW